MFTIDKTYTLPFPREKTFAAWVSSNTVVAPATSMDIHPKLGGHYRLLMETPEFTSKNEGVFTRFEPNQRVTYSWEWNHDGEVSEIDVRFSDEAVGTLVEISHTGFQKETGRAMHHSGWDSYIEGFLKILTPAD